MAKDNDILNSFLRKADTQIYLNENRYNKPKESFKEIAKILHQKLHTKEDILFLDVGCATGEFIWFNSSQFPKARFFGLEINPEIIQAAKSKMPKFEFVVGSILDDNIFKKESFDVITCAGVLSIFDDQTKPIKNLISWLKPGGHLVIYTIINEDPVDLITRYRNVSNSLEPWESGWNIFSKKTFENIFTSIDPNLKCEWKKFKLPFALPKRDDPMRTWTISTENDPFQLINGACQLINGAILYVQKT